jgi:hypothetical protein
MESSEGLLDRLLTHFRAPPAVGAALQVTVRLNVLSVLQLWLSKYAGDFSRPMKIALGEFVEKELATIEGLDAVVERFKEEYVRAKPFKDTTAPLRHRRRRA